MGGIRYVGRVGQLSVNMCKEVVRVCISVRGARQVMRVDLWGHTECGSMYTCGVSLWSASLPGGLLHLQSPEPLSSAS